MATPVEDLTVEQWAAHRQDVTFSKEVQDFANECGSMDFNSWQKGVS
jgi:hypothetical protein